MLQYGKRFFRYLIRAKHWRGHGVHSPFAFDLITNIFEEEKPYYCYEKIEQEREKLLQNKKKIFISDYGTGNSREQKISSIASRSLKKKKYAQLLFRLVNAYNPSNIIELGTSLGVTTAYLASVDSKTPCYTFDACSNSLAVAEKILEDCKIKNVTLIKGDINETLPLLLKSLNQVEFIFFDANHTKEATLNYFYQTVGKVSNKTIFVFDDIHYSDEMEQAWAEIKINKKVRVSFDLFSIGIIFFDENLQKQDYICFF